MFPQSRYLLFVLAFFLHNLSLFGQVDMDCPSPTFFKTFGNEFQAEYGTAILHHSDGHLYLAGRDANRTFIQKMTPSGNVLWTREFQINQFEPVTPSEIIEDSEGMIVGCGTQGFTGLSKGFVFRYDPVNNLLLWAQQISSNNPIAAGILEKGAGGNFIFYQTSQLSSGEKDAEIIEVDRLTGVLNPGLAKRYQYISSDALSKMIYVNGALYASGTSSCRFGNFNIVHTRQLLARFDPGTFDPIWAHLNHLDTLAPVSFLGRDLLADGNALLSAYVGSDEFMIGGVGNDTMYLQKTDLNGNLEWVRSYNVRAGVLKLLSVPDGYVIYGQQDSSQHVVFKTDKNGVPVWGRILAESVTAAVSSNNFPPNQAVAVADSLYFTGTAANGALDVFLWKMTVDGAMVDSCGYMDTLLVESTLVPNPFRTLADFTQVFSTATTVSASPAIQDATLDLHQFCPDCNMPDPCPENNDFVVSINDVYCEQGKINMQFTFCDLDGGTVPDLQVTFYDANPYLFAANELGSYSYSPATSDSCWSPELTDLASAFGAAFVQNGAQIFAVVNVPANADTPFNLDDFPLTGIEECNYANNMSAYTLQFPASPTLNLGPDQSVCPNQAVVLDAGPGFYRYQWSNGLNTQSINVNFSGQFRVTVTDFCGFKQVDTVVVVILQTPQVTENGSFCPGQSVTIRGYTFSQAGIFQQTLPGAGNECDTTATFFITALPYQTRNDIVRFCPGDTVTINGVAYYESGLARDTLPGIVGCDTIIFYFLTELPLPFRFDTAYICQGDSVMVGNYYYSQPGLVFDTIPNMGPIGCDTVIRVQIILLPQITVLETVQFCPGASVTIMGEQYDQPQLLSFLVPSTTGGCDTLLQFALEWYPVPMRAETIAFCPGTSVDIDGNTYTDPGMVEVTVPGQNGECDTLVTYTLEWLPISMRAETIAFCQGGSVTLGGNVYTDPGTVEVTASGQNGECDTLITYTLEWLPAPTRSETVAFCPGTSVEIDGNTYTDPGTVTALVAGVSGECDTVVTYTLEWLPAPMRADTIAFCQGGSVTLGGNTYTDPGTVEITVSGQSGACDTLVTYTLEWLPAPTRSETVAFCPGTSVEIDGNTYTDPGTVTALVAGVSGECDTVVTYTLEWLPAPMRADTIAFCQGDSVTIGGNTYSDPGTVEITIAGQNGACDTLVTYTLEWLPAPTRSETVAFCPGTSVEIDGNTYTDPGTVIALVAGVSGECDTVVIYTLEWLPTPTRSETVAFCPGTSVEIDGNTYTDPGTVTALVAGVSGECDTVVTYTLEWLPFNTAAEAVSFCPGQTVMIGGVAYTQPGTVLDTIPSATGGCDVIVTYTLTFSPLPTRTETVEFCAGGSVIVGGQTYTQPGTATVTVPGTSGACDTVVTYTIQYLDPPPSTLTAHCPFTVNVATAPGTGPIAVNYAAPTATSDCTCPGIAWTLTAGMPSGGLFAPGMTNVCYTAKDSCGSTDECCFTVIVREESACDVKTIGCIKYEIMGITADAQQRYTYRIRVTNACANKLIYTTIQLPDGVVADSPVTNSIYESPDGRDYLVRNPNYTPFYSIRFKSTTDSISNGQSSLLVYTLPQQSHPTFIHVFTRLAPQLGYEAILNTFNCPIGVTVQNNNRIGDRNDDVSDASRMLIAEKSMLLFPNPTSGLLFADLSDWAGQQLTIRVLDSRGQQVQRTSLLATTEAQQMQLPEAMPAGLYFLEVMAENGERTVGRFVLER